MLAKDTDLPTLVVVTAGLGAFGFVLPNILLHNAGQKREKTMQNALPDALDLLTISVEAGLGFDAAVSRVAKNTKGPLAQEFARLLQEMQIGVGRMEAMRAMAERSTMKDFKSFTLAMVQADAFGIPIGRVLRVQSKEMRVKRRQRAEEAAQKVPVKSTLPADLLHPPMHVHRDPGSGGSADDGVLRQVSAMSLSGRPTALPARSWRITTAARVFVIALASGQTVSDGQFDSVGVLLLALAILAAVMCAIEYEPDSAIDRWIPVAEGVLAAALVGTTDAPVAPLLVYLALPPVVAGLRHGWVTTVNTTLACGMAVVGGYVAAEALDLAAPQLRASLPWLCIGLGTGLMAAWLTRSVRALETVQGPYAAAHRLLTQLRTVSLQLPGGFDSQAVAQRIVESVHREADADRAALFVRLGQRTLVAGGRGWECTRPKRFDTEVAQWCLQGKRDRSTRPADCATASRRRPHLRRGCPVQDEPMERCRSRWTSGIGR